MKLNKNILLSAISLLIIGSAYAQNSSVNNNNPQINKNVSVAPSQKVDVKKQEDEKKFRPICQSILQKKPSYKSLSEEYKKNFILECIEFKSKISEIENMAQKSCEKDKNPQECTKKMIQQERQKLIKKNSKKEEMPVLKITTKNPITKDQLIVMNTQCVEENKKNPKNKNLSPSELSKLNAECFRKKLAAKNEIINPEPRKNLVSVPAPLQNNKK